ncbi:hypothetical protein J2S43_002272 [Catenuloplanes nepalensis]|uniref:Uncharacterized protein n=1 Tax=Catenuloplanes nepalensis TaxID=587533 RepID=A0ABT9MQP8_9ACTN|nr:hypothetical protein [Catenuloplanes nepalensis]MDP9793760.1 hypothetical protein [Catenuloplanes nepalensis]
MTVYVAEAAYFTLISRRAPAVNVPCDLVRLGSIVVLRLHDESHAALPNPFAPPASRFWERRRDVLFHLVPDADGCATLHRFLEATVLILDHAPMLHQHVGLDDPSPALSGTLWELSAVLAERAHVQSVLDDLTALPPGAGPADRMMASQARVAELTGVADSYMEQIEALASGVRDFAEQQAVADRYRSALRNSEFLAEADPGPVAAPSGAAELTERMTAVLDAYRDLTER